MAFRRTQTALVFILVIAALMLRTSALADTNTYTNNTPGISYGATDERSSGKRMVSVPTNYPITDVNLVVDFHSIDGTDCANPGTEDYSYPDSIEFWVTSPQGTKVYLVYSWYQVPGRVSTYNYQGLADRVVVNFDDEAPTKVGEDGDGLPMSGTFRPEEPLSAFDGENPSGEWTFHFIGWEHFVAVCFYSMTLVIEDTGTAPTDTPIPPTHTPTETPVTPTLTPTITPTNTPSGPLNLAASASCVDENLQVTISDGDPPFDITSSLGGNTPISSIGIGTWIIQGPDKWNDLTVRETGGNMELINLGQFKCRTDERPVPLLPAHRARITDPFPTFSWTGITGASDYIVFLFDDPSPAGRTLYYKQSSHGETMMQLGTPLPSKRLFWRVRGRQNRVWSVWSVRFTLFKDPIMPFIHATPIISSNGITAPNTRPTPVPLGAPTLPAPPNSR